MYKHLRIPSLNLLLDTFHLWHFLYFPWLSHPAWNIDDHYEYSQPGNQILIHVPQTIYFLLSCSSLSFWIQKTKEQTLQKNTLAAWHDFHSHHPLSCKESIIYSQALWYNMIISDNISQEELNNLTRIPLACAYPLYLIIKNIKNPSTTPAVTRYFNGNHIQNWRFTPLYRSFVGHRQIIYKHHAELAHKFHAVTLSTSWPS